MKKSSDPIVVILGLGLSLFALITPAQTTAFKYQGSLTDGGGPANGSFQMQFKLFDSLSGGTQIGSTINDVPVTASLGHFSARLDFGANALGGANRWLEISVRRNSGESYVTLSPREQIASAPYSVRTLSAASADDLSTACVGCVENANIDSVAGSKVTGTVASATTATNASQLGGVAANQFVQTADPRLSDARNPLPGSANYIQSNPSARQTGSNFDIGGTGSANILNAEAQINIRGSRILGNPGTDNLFAGIGAGQATIGQGNTLVGAAAGQNTTTGGGNSFFGRSSGLQNIDGTLNAFFGDSAGRGNTSGSTNSVYGALTGLQMSTGSFNSLFGAQAGYSNAAGHNNSAFGYLAGFYTTGNFNSFFGSGTAYNNTGNYNAFYGASAGVGNLSGSFNTLLGYSTDVGSTDLSYATAVGSGAVVNSSNTLVLGRNLDAVKVPGAIDIFGPVTGQFVLGVGNGGTGLNTPGASGRFLRSDGTIWTSSLLQASDVPSGSNHYIQNTLSPQNASFNINGYGYITGGVGVGTISGTHKLAVIGGSPWTTSAWAGSVELANASAIGWQPNASGLSFGIGQTTTGLHIFNTTSPLGTGSAVANNTISIANNGKVGIGTTNPTSGRLVVDRATDNGVAVSLTGSAIQNPNSLGWVKALLFIDGGGSIHRCFNGVTGEEYTGSSPTACGFSVGRTSFGGYSIDFPFGVRFATASTYYDSAQTLNHSATLIFSTNTRIIVRIFVTGNSAPDDLADRSFMLIVF